MKSKTFILFVAILIGTFVFIGISINNPTLMPSENTQEAGDAYFNKVISTNKMYQGKQYRWKFVVFNENCSEDAKGRAWFFFKFYRNGELWFDESNSTTSETWQCSKGSVVTRTYRIQGWINLKPSAEDIKIELYWDYMGTPYLQDTTSFTITWVMFIHLSHIVAFSYLFVYLIFTVGLSIWLVSTGPLRL